MTQRELHGHRGAFCVPHGSGLNLEQGSQLPWMQVLRCMQGPQRVTSPVRLLPPCHIGVTGSHEGLPGGDHILGALSPGEDQEAARSTAHVMYQLLKCLLARGGKTVSQGRGPRACSRPAGPSHPQDGRGSVSSLATGLQARGGPPGGGGPNHTQI